MEAKFIIFWIFLLVSVPSGVFLTKLWKPSIHFFFAGMILSLIEPHLFSINFFSRENYTMITRGLEFGLVDICTLVVFVGMFLRPREFKLNFFPPLTVIFMCYILTIIVSWVMVDQSTLPAPGPRTTPDLTIPGAPVDVFEVALYPLFEFTKICRGVFIFFVSYNYLKVTKNFNLIFFCFAITLYYSLLVCLKQRYLMGYHRIPGNLAHANSLATYTCLLATPVLGKAFFESKNLSSLFYLGAAGAAALIVILTISRGGMAVMVLSFTAVTIYSLKRFFNTRNLIYTVGAIIVFILMLIVSFDSLKTRFFQDAKSDYTYREQYNIEAMHMVRDHPFGVGIGNFSAFSWYKYGELVDEKMKPGTPAHNFFFLNLAELGYAGAFIFLLIFIKIYLVSWRLLRRNLKKEDHLIAFTLSMAIIVMMFQEFLNYSFRQQPVIFSFMVMTAGLMVLSKCSLQELEEVNTEPDGGDSKTLDEKYS